MEERVISERAIYHGRIVNLAVKQVELANGQPAEREIITHPGAVAIVALDAEQNILLVRQFRLAAGHIMLEIPAGTLEAGEPPLDCAVRELREETGYRPQAIEPLGGLYVAPGYTTEFIHLFLVRGVEYDPLEQDADEAVEVVRMTFDEALARIEDGTIADGKTIAGLLRVARRLSL